MSPKELGTDPDRLLSRSQNERQRVSLLLEHELSDNNELISF